MTHVTKSLNSVDFLPFIYYMYLICWILRACQYFLFISLLSNFHILLKVAKKQATYYDCILRKDNDMLEIIAIDELRITSLVIQYSNNHSSEFAIVNMV